MPDSGSEKRRLFEQEVLPLLDVLYTAALYLTRNEEEANDLCQETVLRAYRYFHQYTAGTNCRAWLLTILHNLFRTARSRPKLERVAAAEEEFDRAVDRESLGRADATTNPEGLLLRRSMDQSVQTALYSLPEDFRTALLLVDVQELTYQEAAKVLEVPLGTVRSRISRGRALMRRALQSFAGAYGLIRVQT